MEREDLGLLSISGAAKLLKIGTGMIRNLINEGRISTILVGKRERISIHELSRFVTQEVNRGERPKLNPFVDHQHQSNNCTNGKDILNGRAILENLIKEEVNGYCNPEK